LGGTHNISNALAVVGLALELGIDLEFIKKALLNYQGAGRRLEVKFTTKEIMVIDDYAHHPTEIKATLAALESLHPKRTVAVFQPHRYSRTKILLDDFASSFSDVDYLVITDIYAASEMPIEGVSAELLCDSIKRLAPEKQVVYLPKEKIVEWLLRIRRPGDLFITLGAGDIAKVSNELAQELRRQA
jgi:UDP-N-acetylmuramate--alanine ligase